jgi:glycosyltransferase involved in cell wall biosynthesis
MNHTACILSLITHFSHLPLWEENTTRIDIVDPDWAKRSLLAKAWTIVRLAPQYDCIVFFYDTRLPVIFWFLYCLFHLSKPRLRIVFTTFLCDVAPFVKLSYSHKDWMRARLRYYYYLVFTRIVKTIVVHSSAEINIYASMFRVPRNHFRFIPYFVRRDALSSENEAMTSTVPYILVAGRHRDLQTFMSALHDSSFHGVIIAGRDDEHSLLQQGLPPNIEAHFELPFSQYRAWIAGAAAFIVPLSSDQTIRSLGQIATFEAVAHNVPVIASRTFQLMDYFKDGEEILFYQPGNSQELRKQIELAMTTQALRDQLTQRAYRRMLEQYTDERYCEALLNVCVK